MKAWFVIPSARPVDEVQPVVQRWQGMGYGVVIQRDIDKMIEEAFPDTHVFYRAYEGYADAVNFLAAWVLQLDPGCDWIVTGGDDTFPDQNKTGDEIARELRQHFCGKAYPHLRESGSIEELEAAATFAVVQPTGDRWTDNRGVIIERIAGSPWLGRNWCQRAWGGRGPLWPEFRHQFVDEALQVYAQSLGVFLQRPDLTHYHAHAQRDGKSRPAPHMAEWNSQKHWQESKAIFERLKSTNFAECQPIP